MILLRPESESYPLTSVVRPKAIGRHALVSAFLFLILSATGCGGGSDGANNPAASTQANANATAPDGADASSANEAPNLVPVSDLEKTEVGNLNKAWTGDFGEIVKRGFIRALVVYNRTSYFMDKAEQRGIAYDSLVELEKSLHSLSADKNITLKVVIIPTSRARLLERLAAGNGDIAIGNLTITPEREKLVDFSDPMIDNVDEVVVTGPTAPAIESIADLSGKEVYVRASSSFRTSLDALNNRFRAEGKEPVTIRFADEQLEEEDIIQMTDAGVFPMTVVDLHVAKFWSQLYDRVKVREDLVLKSGNQIAVAIRKNAPELKRIINDFVRTHKEGTMFGNMMLKRYMGTIDRLKNPAEDKELERFRSLVAYLRKYSDQYDLPWLLVAAQGYQESQLDQTKRSPVGAIGVMQIKPDTAAGVGIPDIETAENNIHAGVKYLRFILDRYFKDAPMDKLNKGLFAFASYNAGPARVAELRRKAEERGFDPNVWFNNVEIIASREIGRETVDYVKNIYKYYTVYQAVSERQSQREKARKS